MRNSLRVAGISLLVASTLVLWGCGGAEARRDGYLERGDEYFNVQNYEKARVEYRNAAQIDPTDPRGHFGIARVSEKLGDLKNAVAQYQATIDLDPKHLMARASLGRIYLVGGLPDKAFELVEVGLQQAPAHPQLLTVRAAVRSHEKKFDEAFADVTTAYQDPNRDEYTIALLASLYRQRGEQEKAMATVREGIERMPKNIDLRVVLAELAMRQEDPKTAEEQLRKIVELEPKELQHRIRLTRFYVATKNIDAAESALREAIGSVADSATAKIALIEFLTAMRSPAAAEKQLQEFIAQNPKDDQLKLQLGSFYEQRQQFDLAEKSYRDVIGSSKLKVEGLAARNRLAAMLLKRNDVETAATLIGEVLKENARDNDALVMRGNIALVRGDTSAAIVDLRSVLRDQPASAPVLRALARAHLQNGETALAEEALRNAVQANPRDTAARLDLGRLLAQMNKLEQARTIFEQLASAPEASIEAQEAHTRVLVSLKEFGAAREAAAKVIETRPDLALGHFLAGAIEEADGKNAAAIIHYQAALAAQPRAAEPLTALVRMDLARKQPEKAMAILDKAVASDPNHSVALNLRAELLASQQRTKEASASYEAAIAAEPKWWVPHRGLAITRAMEKDFAGAKTALRHGIDATGGSIQLYGELSALCEKIGEHDCAVETYESWLKKHPSSTMATNNLAMLLATHRKDEASLRRARELATRLSGSNESSVLDTRGWVDYKSGNFREAIELFERAIAQSADKAAFKYHLGMAHLAAGNSEAARRNLEAALSQGKPFMGIEEAQSVLKQLQQSGA